MGQIGFTDGTGMTGYSQATTNAHRLCTGTGATYTPSVAEEAYQLNIRAGVTLGTVEVGIYNVTGGNPGAPLVGSFNFTTTSSNTLQTYSIPSPIQLTAGQTYAVAFRAVTTLSMQRVYSATHSRNGTLTGTSALGSTWSDSAVGEYKYGIWLETRTAGPNISNTSDDTPTSGTTLTLNGTSFGTQTGSAQVTVGGVVVTPSSWSASQIQIPITIGNNLYGVNVPIVVRDSAGVSSAAYNVQIQPASGVNYVNLSGTLASSGDRITATPDLASGDQVEWSNVVGGTISDVTVNADASFVASSGVISFDVRVNDGTGWGTYATQLLVAGRGIVRPLVRSLTNNLVTNLVG